MSGVGGSPSGLLAGPHWPEFAPGWCQIVVATWRARSLIGGLWGKTSMLSAKRAALERDMGAQYPR